MREDTTAMDKKQTWILIGVMAAIAIGVSALILVSGGREEKTKQDASAGNLPGLQETAGPWQPEYQKLAERVKLLGLPSPGSERYHVHARLAVYVDGKRVPVPANIGVNQPVVSALHSHDADGVIHLESDEPFDATLGDFFGLWGVKFSDSQIGSYQNDGDKKVQVYVNGQLAENPVEYKLKAKDNIVVGYGTPGSFPTTITAPFPEGL